MPRAVRRRSRWRRPASRRRPRDRQSASGSWRRNPQAKARRVQDFLGGDGLPAAGDVEVGAQQIERAGHRAEQAGDLATGVMDRADSAGALLNEKRDKALVEAAQLVEQGRLRRVRRTLAKQ